MPEIVLLTCSTSKGPSLNMPGAINPTVSPRRRRFAFADGSEPAGLGARPSAASAHILVIAERRLSIMEGIAGRDRKQQSGAPRHRDQRTMDGARLRRCEEQHDVGDRFGL